MEAPLDLANRLKTAAMSLLEVKTDDFMHKVIVRATQELLLQTAARFAQQAIDKELSRVDFESWARKQSYFAYDENDSRLLDRDEDGYTDACVHAAWMAYSEKHHDI